MSHVIGVMISDVVDEPETWCGENQLSLETIIIDSAAVLEESTRTRPYAYTRTRVRVLLEPSDWW